LGTVEAIYQEVHADHVGIDKLRPDYNGPTDSSEPVRLFDTPPSEKLFTLFETLHAATEGVRVDLLPDRLNATNQAEPDFDALATALRKARKPTQAALVNYMADKRDALAEEIAAHVHGDEETSEDTMRMNARRTNDSLIALGSSLLFRFAAGRMFREISSE
jgi:hypothetical protein